MNEFIKYLENKNLARSTQEAYLLNVNLFLKWYKAEPINCTPKDILKYLEYLKNKKQQQNITRRNYLIALNHYFNHLLTKEEIIKNPCSLIKIRGTNKKHLYNIFTIEQLSQLADDFYNVHVKNYDDNHIPKNQRQQAYLTKARNYCALTFLVYQGLHTNELQRITLDDIDLIKAKVKVQGGKKSTDRTLTLKAEQIGILMHYIQNIREQILEFYGIENNNLFLTMPKVSNRTTESSSFMNVIKPLTKQVKSINPNFNSFKQIRASVITYWIKTYGLRKTQYLAGHRHIRCTENYLPNDLESLIEDIAKFNPF